MAKKYGVQLVVRSSLNYAEGTVVKEETKMEKMVVSGVASDMNTARISVIGVKDEPGIAFKLFNYLAAKNINIDIILQSVARDGRRDIAFTVPKTELQEALAIIEEHKDAFTANSFKYDEHVAKVSIIGAGTVSYTHLKGDRNQQGRYRCQCTQKAGKPEDLSQRSLPLWFRQEV